MKCINCGHNLEEKFCPNCGEKKFDSHELTVKHFVLETTESFTHLDNKLFRSIKILIAKPGELTLHFVTGKRVSYMKPLQLFLILNIFLFFMPANPFALKLYNYVTYRPFTNYNTQSIVDQKIKLNAITIQEYEPVFNEKMQSDSKEFIFLFIPFYALLFSLMFFRLNGKFIEHIIFATHFMGFYMLLTVFSALIIELPFYYITKIYYSQFFDALFSGFTQGIILVYLYLAIRRFYKTHWGYALFSAAIIAATFFMFLQYYRMLLFFKIIYAD